MKLDYHVVKSAVNWYFGRYVDRERRPTFNCFRCPPQQNIETFVRLGVPARQFKAPLYNHEKIVEVVSESARELA